MSHLSNITNLMASPRIGKLPSILIKLPCGLFTAIVTIAILWLTLAPHPLPSNKLSLIPGMDKLIHAMMFGGLAFALICDYLNYKHKHVPSSVGSTNKTTATDIALSTSMAVRFGIIATMFGGIIEILQNAMHIGRSGDWFDFLADAIGVAIIVVCASKFITVSSSPLKP